MKIIDFRHKGNSVRFYFGRDDLTDWYGDDWNDAPYEHNAGQVYDEFITGYVDVTWPFDDYVIEPKDDWHNDCNSQWCKDDMRERRVPCIIIVPGSVSMDSYYDSRDFNYWVANDAVYKIYFGDILEKMGTMGGAISMIMSGDLHE